MQLDSVAKCSCKSRVFSSLRFRKGDHISSFKCPNEPLVPGTRRGGEGLGRKLRKIKSFAQRSHLLPSSQLY